MNQQPPEKHGVRMRKARGCIITLDPAMVVSRFREGATIGQMIRAFHTTHGRIASILRDAGVTIKRGRKPTGLSIEHLKPKAQAIAARYQQGWTGPRLCEHYKADWKAIRAVLVSEGVRVKGMGEHTKEVALTLKQRDRLIARIKECRGTQLQIAKDYGISREMVRQYAQKIGCTWYTQSEKSKRSAPITQERNAKHEASRQHKRTLRAQAKAIAAEMWAQGCTLAEIGDVIEMPANIAGARMTYWRTQSPELFPHRRKPRRKVSHI